MKKTETVYQVRMTETNRRIGTRLGVRLTMRSSTPSKNEMIMTRTFVSHASHARSLNLVSPMSACVFQSPRPPGSPSGQVFSSIRELSNHREQRQVERNHNPTHH